MQERPRVAAVVTLRMGLPRGNSNRKLAEKFGWVGRSCFCVFAGVFEKSGVQNVVFLWSMCGELCGKGGYRTDSFCRAKIMQGFRIYFWVGPAV